MLTKVYSAALHGADALEVEIEVNEGSGDPKVIIVGLPDAAVKESKDRVTTAMANSGYRWPRGRTTINLAPADLKKEGPSFDLPIAVGMLAVAHGRDLPRLRECCLAGELALTGAIRPIKGVLPIALEARRRGKAALLVPAENAAEASMVQGLSVHGVRNLRECFEFLDGKKAVEATRSDPDAVFRRHHHSDFDFADVKGQASVKRAFEVAVAGGHNLLVIGAPGAGKSMLAKRIPGIMPAMTLEEAIETTKIHSICGLLDTKHSFLATRPFRAPHHTISAPGLVGGGRVPRPGEITLAHLGVLFLDEVCAFAPAALDALRQPLEEGCIDITRAQGTARFPAEPLLVCAGNPCPCGHAGDPQRACTCAPAAAEAYRARISGPVADRIDLRVDMPRLHRQEMLDDQAQGEGSATVRGRVQAARACQRDRGQGMPNARLGASRAREVADLDREGRTLLGTAIDRLGLTARGCDRVIRVARTIADLGGSSRVEPAHLAEALRYRSAGAV